MKKILAIVAMAAMVAGAAFADPEANVAITTFAGRAGTEWGVDLDSDDVGTGFKNYASVDFVISLFDAGSKQTEGEGIWAELSVDAGNNNSWNHYAANTWGGSGDITSENSFSLNIGTAKLHFYNFYVGLLSGDTTVGKLQLTNAVRSSDNDNGTWLSAVGEDKSQGLVFGYGDNKNIGIAFDFRSKASGDNYYTNDYGLAGEFNLLDSNEFLPGLFATVGGSFAFNEKVLGAAASAGYKLAIDDTFYVKPVAGWTMQATAGDDFTVTKNAIAAGLFLGWGDTADANAGVYYLDNDNAKKVTPGVGVSALIDVTDSDAIAVTISPSLYTGSIVENLTAAVYSDIVVPTTDGAELGFGIAGGVKYAIAATDSVTVTPQAGVRYATAGLNSKGSALITANNTNNAGKNDTDNADTKGLFNVKVGLDVSGLINNTTFKVWWQSRNLLDEGNNIGTINVGCEIAL